VEGETLQNLIKRTGRLDVKLALEVATQVATGLAAIHEQNLVHRDIKPTNIMVRLKEGGAVTAKIIDLGLAKAVDESASEAGISSPGAFAWNECNRRLIVIIEQLRPSCQIVLGRWSRFSWPSSVAAVPLWPFKP
jgi:serine/threonine protein kinase